MAKTKQPRDNKAAQLSEHSKRRGAYTQEDLAVERGKLKIKKAQSVELNVERVQHNQKKARQMRTTWA